MASASHRYIGSLYVNGRPDLNLDGFDLETSEGREFAVSELSRQALEEMERRAITAASLAITEDDYGIGTFPLENAKYALRP